MFDNGGGEGRHLADKKRFWNKAYSFGNNQFNEQQDKQQFVLYCTLLKVFVTSESDFSFLHSDIPRYDELHTKGIASSKTARVIPRGCFTERRS